MHGDIKPDNFLVRSDGRVLLADFGFAAIRPKQSRNLLTFADWETEPRGTPGYSAPATLREDGCCTHKTDIFSLGVVFLELMSGTDKAIFDTFVAPKDFPGGAASWSQLSMDNRMNWLLWNFKNEGQFSSHDGLDLCQMVSTAYRHFSA